MAQRPREWFKNLKSVEVPTLKITFAGLFDMKELYKLIHEWLKDGEWRDSEGSDDLYHEILYHERISISGSKDFWIWWRMKKPSGSNYYYYTLDINFLILGMTTSEVIHNGQKVKAHNGEVNIDITAKMNLDQEFFDKSIFLRPFKYWFPERIFKKDIESHYDELYREAYNLQGTIKKFLQLKGFLAKMEVEPFSPSLRYK